MAAAIAAAGPLLFLTVAARAGTPETDAWECFRIADPGAGSEPRTLSAELDPSGLCRLRAKATLACSSAGLGSSAAPLRESPELAYDQLCYRVRCPEGHAAPGSEADALPIELTDGFGSRVLHRGEANFVCTPAFITFPPAGSADANAATPDPDSNRSEANAEALTCGDFSGNGTINAADALGALRTAIGSATCLPCVCDTDRNGNTTAADALRILRKSVGQDIALDCQADGSPVSWTGAGDGKSWHDPANWSTATRIPNLCEDVTIDAPDLNVLHTQGDSGALRVTSVSSLQLDGGTLRIRDTASVAGLFSLHGGTLKDATVVAPVGMLVVGKASNPRSLTGTAFSGTLDGVTIDDLLDLGDTSSQVRVLNGLTINGTVAMGLAANVRFQGGTGQVLDGSGEVVFGSSGGKSLSIDSGTSVTIGPDLTIRGALGTVGSQGGLTNQGTIDSDEPGLITVTSNVDWTNDGTIRGQNGGDVRLEGSWTNNGTLHIEDGGDLTLDGEWTNTGTITSDESNVFLDGNFTLAALGNLDRTGGAVNITGILDNAADLTLDATTGSWNLRGGTIRGGTVTSTEGARLVGTAFGGVLDEVVLESGIDLIETSSNVRVLNGLTLDATIVMGLAANIRFQGGTSQLFDGSGEIVFGSSGGKSLTVDSGTSLTIGPDITIRGALGTVGSQGALTNEGTIDSDEPGLISVTANVDWTNEGIIRGQNGGDLRLEGPWTNNGAISIEDGGDLTLDGEWTNAGTITSDESNVFLDGTFTLAALGSFERTGGTVNITGVFENAAGLTLDATTGSWNLRGGTIRGGTVTTTDGARLVGTAFSGTLDEVVLASGIDLTDTSSQVRVLNGLTLNDTIDMGLAASIRFMGGTGQVLDGGGDIVFGATGGKSLSVDSGTSLSIGPDITIRGAQGTVGSQGALTNEGTIDSDEPGLITVTAYVDWTNEGTIRGQNGGDIHLEGPWTNNGAISIEDGGDLTLDGEWTNEGTIDSDESNVFLAGTFTLADLGDFDRTGGTVNLTGILDNSADLVLDATTGSWNLRGGTIRGGTVTTTGGARLVGTGFNGTLDDGVVLASGMDLSETSSQVRVQDGLTLNGTIDMGLAASIRFMGGTSQVLDGGGEIVFGPTGGKNVTVDPDTSLTIGPDITIRGGIGTVSSQGALTNEGTIDSDAPGTITVTSTAGWTNNGTIRASLGDLSLGSAGTNQGLIEVAAGRELTASAGFTQGGAGTLSIDIGGLASFAEVKVTGAATLTGTLDINLTGGFDPAIGATFTVLTFTSRVGDFSNVTGLAIGGGKKFSRTFTANAMVLEVVSE